MVVPHATGRGGRRVRPPHPPLPRVRPHPFARVRPPPFRGRFPPPLPLMAPLGPRPPPPMRLLPPNALRPRPPWPPQHAPLRGPHALVPPPPPLGRFFPEAQRFRDREHRARMHKRGHKKRTAKSRRPDGQPEVENAREDDSKVVGGDQVQGPEAAIRGSCSAEARRAAAEPFRINPEGAVGARLDFTEDPHI